MDSRLTLALSGRATTRDASCGRTMYEGARGAPATRQHEPLERVVRSPHEKQAGTVPDGEWTQLPGRRLAPASKDGSATAG